MKDKTFTIIIISAVLLIIGGSIFMGYRLKECPPQYTILPRPQPMVEHKTDTFYIIKEKIKIQHENNPYVIRPVVNVSVFDSIAKYYGN